ncbi:MAG: folate-binding protein YgfZ [Acidobacteria bacterium]|nr:folate-binding protein YgfZ [Acidobacteriota bacterium]
MIESYRALRDGAAIGAIAPRRVIAVGGADRASFLHGLLTNDVQSLTSESGCYAAWLTPQGRMITDLHVFEDGKRILLDVPAELAAALLQRLDQNVFTEDVQLTDLSRRLAAVWIHGPSGAAVLERVLGGASGLGEWPDYRHAAMSFAGADARVARVDQLGVTGFCVYVDAEREADLRAALTAAGGVPADPEAIEAARIEAGYPVFGFDMTADTIPLEAGIEDRAISFTKGCYVGQEVIVRVLHRGHGRVARRLVGLRLDGSASRGARVLADGREIGVVTSAASSPSLGPIAMGYVHRDFTPSGTHVMVEAAGGTIGAVVSDRPIARDDR